LPTVFFFHLVKGTWLVELVCYKNSKDEMVQKNSGTKSGHMSWSEKPERGSAEFGSGPEAVFLRGARFNRVLTRKVCQ